MSPGGELRVVGYVGTTPITDPPSILMRIGTQEIRVPIREPALRLVDQQEQRPRPAPTRARDGERADRTDTREPVTSERPNPPPAGAGRVDVYL